ncbi:unnamed protein product [Protopolystoma xenopodis]|uniref:Tubby C-terminal domain-containing protein n=1 Tax=Protopolystoma xenopodis TaxID=117903 RepID=A0A448WWI9_9PLAT|nr:unnamed protein product [Protopolystoma xenopodis]
MNLLKGVTMRCRISRDKRGVDRGIYPTYFLHLEREDDRRFFLLAARRRKRSATSNYLISCDATDLSRDGDAYVGKLRANFLGTQFIIYGNGRSSQPLASPTSDLITGILRSSTDDSTVAVIEENKTLSPAQLAGGKSRTNGIHSSVCSSASSNGESAKAALSSSSSTEISTPGHVSDSGEQRRELAAILYVGLLV